MPLVFGGTGVVPSTRGQASTVFTLQAGAVQIIPAGTWYIGSRKYSRVQEFDPTMGIWRNIGDDSPFGYVRSDGVNVRLANQTGCAIGALMTTAGTLYTSAPTVTPSAGASVWQAIVGGALNTTVTVSNGGASYVYPPLVEIAAPPAPGIQATAYCTLSGGAVSTITVDNQGAGYTQAPQISLINDSRDTTGYNAQATCVLTGAGTITGVLCTDHGTPLTALPTLAFSGGGGSAAAATVLMDWCFLNATLTAAGVAYNATGGYVVVTAANVPVTGGTGTNPASQNALLKTRPARLLWPTTTNGALAAATGVIVDDGGHYLKVPLASEVEINFGNSIVTTAASLTAPTVGGLADTIQMFPI